MYQNEDERQARASGQKRKAGLPSSGDASQVRSRIIKSGFAEACFQGSACAGQSLAAHAVHLRNAMRKVNAAVSRGHTPARTTGCYH